MNVPAILLATLMTGMSTAVVTQKGLMESAVVVM